MLCIHYFFIKRKKLFGRLNISELRENLLTHTYTDRNCDAEE